MLYISNLFIAICQLYLNETRAKRKTNKHMLLQDKYLLVLTTYVFSTNARDVGSVPGSGRSPGHGLGNPLQYAFPDNPMGRGAWWAKVHGVSKDWDVT